MTDPSDRPVSVVTRREALSGAGLALGSLVASGTLTETVLAQSGGPSDEISGTVEDDSGPVDGATVVAVPHDTSLAALETTTDANGEYIFEQSDLHEDSNLYHVIARDGTESDPRRGVPNYPFIAAEGFTIPDSAVHHWEMGEGSGSTLNDNIGTNDISLSGPTWASGDWVDGWATDWDGVDDTASASTLTSVISPTTSFAVSVSIRTRSSSNTQYILYHQETDSNRFAMQLTSGTIVAGLYDGSSFQGGSSGSVATDTNLRVVYNYDGAGGGSLYINNSELTGTLNVGTRAGNDGVFTLGQLADGNEDFFDGLMDDILVYSEPLDADQRQDDYDRQPWS